MTGFRIRWESRATGREHEEQIEDRETAMRVAEEYSRSRLPADGYAEVVTTNGEFVAEFVNGVQGLRFGRVSK